MRRLIIAFVVVAMVGPLTAACSSREPTRTSRWR